MWYTHVSIDNFSESPVPVFDDTVYLWLDQQLCALACLKLGSKDRADSLGVMSGLKYSTYIFHHIYSLYLNNMLLARFLFRCPLHWPTTEIHSKFWLRLVPSKLLKMNMKLHCALGNAVISTTHLSLKLSDIHTIFFHIFTISVTVLLLGAAKPGYWLQLQALDVRR